MASFPPTAVVFKGEDGPITYHLVFLMYQFDARCAELLASAGGWHEGVVDFDGVKKRLQLIDGNVNGTFNDIAPDPYRATACGSRATRPANAFWAGCWKWTGSFIRIEVARDGAFVKVQEVDNATLGQVQGAGRTFPKSPCIGENGHFVRQPGQRPIHPAGGHITGPSNGRSAARMKRARRGRCGAMISPRPPASMSPPARPDALEVGEPAQAVLGVSETPGRLDIFSIRFEGRQKEAIEILREGQRPAGPKLTLAQADGTVCHSDTFEFG